MNPQDMQEELTQKEAVWFAIGLSAAVFASMPWLVMLFIKGCQVTLDYWDYVFSFI